MTFRRGTTGVPQGEPVLTPDATTHACACNENEALSERGREVLERTSHGCREAQQMQDDDDRNTALARTMRDNGRGGNALARAFS